MWPIAHEARHPRWKELCLELKPHTRIVTYPLLRQPATLSRVLTCKEHTRGTPQHRLIARRNTLADSRGRPFPQTVRVRVLLQCARIPYWLFVPCPDLLHFTLFSVTR